MNKQDIAIIGCLVFILASAGFVYFKINPISVHHLLSFGNDGQTKGAKVNIKPQKRSAPAMVTSQPNKTGADDTLFNRLANEPAAKKIDMTDVIGSNTSGIAYILRENGRVYISATANMPDAPQGGFYQAWLMKETPRRYFVPLGNMKSYGVGKFISNTALDLDYPDFNYVVITLETVEDKMPERFVMQGKMP